MLFFEALWWQYYTRLLLVFIPFRRIIKLYPSPTCPERSRGVPPLEALTRIKTATAQANLLAIWKNRCLVQSLAARCMLSRRGIPSTLHFGMTQTPEGHPTAHAWLTAGHFEVVNKGQVEVELLGRDSRQYIVSSKKQKVKKPHSGQILVAKSKHTPTV